MRRFIAFVVLSTSIACRAEIAESDGEADVAWTADEITAVCGGKKLVRGVDVSHWQGRVDWDAMKKSGNTFAIARISDGLAFPDTEFDRNWPAMKAAGLIRGAYQFFRPGDDA